METEYQQTACVLCSINCGLEVRVEDRRFARIRGDKRHVQSAGYTCEKALRLDHYQNGADRLTQPLLRAESGEFVPVSWEVAIAEAASRLGAVRDQWGGASIFYYGGGGQGNHLGGSYAGATLAALGSIYRSNALAQEKTGEYWVDGQLFGRPRCHTAGDFERCEVAVFVGKNPWQSHGFPQARRTLKAIANDPERAMIVIDPRRSETAELADIHLQLAPGTDVWCLRGLLVAMIDEDLIDREFIEARTVGFEQLAAAVMSVDVGECARRCDVDESLIREAARRIAGASSVSVFEDLGIQQAPQSTLNSYLEKLLYLLTGNFAVPGGMNIHTRMQSLGGGSGGGRRSRTSPVTGSRIITGLVPANVIPDEVLTDHPDRFRAMIVESSNPAHSLADSPRFREAFEALDTLVVIDVAMTETARMADIVLPAPTQYEKWECAFFTTEFPQNSFQLRAPILEPPADSNLLPEPEIHRRLTRALGVLDHVGLDSLHAAAAAGLAEFGTAFINFVVEHPELKPYLSVVLMETLGATLDNGAAAVLWGLAHSCAREFPDSVARAGFADGDELFIAILDRREGVVFSIDDYDETWKRIVHADGRIHLAIDELLDTLPDIDEVHVNVDFPYVLSAGERRSTTSTTMFRDPEWRRGTAPSLRISPHDAAELRIGDGDVVDITSEAGTVKAPVEVTDSLRPGHVSLPNGTGLDYPDTDDTGPAPNQLTSSGHRDWFAGTPLHKHVPVRITPHRTTTPS
jgi:anaerobic selenocysteine-containing dehydrogenase